MCVLIKKMSELRNAKSSMVRSEVNLMSDPLSKSPTSMPRAVKPWPRNAKKLCKQWRTTFRNWNWVYMEAESRSRKANRWLNITQYVVMALAPTTSFVDFMAFMSNDLRLSLAGAFGAAGMVLKSLSSLLKFDERIASLHETAIRFQTLSKSIENEMISTSDMRTDWNAFKQRVIETHMGIISSASPVPIELMQAAGVMPQNGTSTFEMSDEIGDSGESPPHKKMDEIVAASKFMNAFARRKRNTPKKRFEMNQLATPKWLFTAAETSLAGTDEDEEKPPNFEHTRTSHVIDLTDNYGDSGAGVVEEKI